MRVLGWTFAIAACGGGHHGSSQDAALADGTPDAATVFTCPPNVTAPICSVDHVCWYDPLPQGENFLAISGGGCDYWLAGASRYIYRLDETGLTPMAVPTQYGGWEAVLELNPDDAWVDSNAGVAHFDGATWTSLGTTGILYDGVWGAASNDVWIATSEGIAHWDGHALATALSMPQGVGAIAGTSASDVWALANPMLHYDGTSWSTRPTPQTGNFPTAIWGSDPSTWYAVNVAVGSSGDTSSVWRWDGTGWSQVYSELQPLVSYGFLLAIGGTGPNDVWAAGQYLDHVVHFDGTSWTKVPLAPPLAVINAIRGTPGGDVVFAGADGFFARWDGTALTELSKRSGMTDDWRGAWGTSASDVWLVGQAGQSWHFDGTAWTQLAPVPGALWSITGSSSSDVWAGGSTTHAVVYHWTGSAWSPTDLGVAGQVFGMYAAATNDVWAVGKGIAFHYDGTWTQTTMPSTARLTSVWGNATEAWAAGDGALLHWTAGAWSVATAPSSTPTAVWGRSPTEIYVGDVFGKLFRWNGTTFTMVFASTGTVWSISGDATRMWAALSGGALYDDGTGLRRLAATVSNTVWTAYFPSSSDGWLAGGGGELLRYQP